MSNESLTCLDKLCSNFCLFYFSIFSKYSLIFLFSQTIFLSNIPIKKKKKKKKLTISKNTKKVNVIGYSRFETFNS